MTGHLLVYFSLCCGAVSYAFTNLVFNLIGFYLLSSRETKETQEQLVTEFVVLQTHEELLHLLSHILRRNPLLASEDILQYIRDAGVDVATAAQLLSFAEAAAGR